MPLLSQSFSSNWDSSELGSPQRGSNHRVTLNLVEPLPTTFRIESWISQWIWVERQIKNNRFRCGFYRSKYFYFFRLIGRILFKRIRVFSLNDHLAFQCRRSWIIIQYPSLRTNQNVTFLMGIDGHLNKNFLLHLVLFLSYTSRWDIDGAYPCLHRTSCDWRVMNEWF